MSTIGGVGSYQPPSYTPPTFTQLDSNSDGGVSLSEFEADAPDGSSSSGASSATQQNPAEALFNKIDTNGDGSISSAEFSSFQSQATQQQSAQQFLTQLMASGQSGATSASSASGTSGGVGGAHHGHHHHGGGVEPQARTALDDSRRDRFDRRHRQLDQPGRVDDAGEPVERLADRQLGQRLDG